MTPDEGAEIHTPDGEKARQEVNEWIRTSGAFDSVWDFDAVWRDPARPGRIRDHLHAGDFLHGKPRGAYTGSPSPPVPDSAPGEDPHNFCGSCF